MEKRLSGCPTDSASSRLVSFESRLHMDFNTDNHFSKLRSGGDLD